MLLGPRQPTKNLSMSYNWILGSADLLPLSAIGNIPDHMWLHKLRGHVAACQDESVLVPETLLHDKHVYTRAPHIRLGPLARTYYELVIVVGFRCPCTECSNSFCRQSPIAAHCRCLESFLPLTMRCRTLNGFFLSWYIANLLLFT